MWVVTESGLRCSISEKKIDAFREYLHLAGTIPDINLAKICGFSANAIALCRAYYKIPAYKHPTLTEEQKAERRADRRAREAERRRAAKAGLEGDDSDYIRRPTSLDRRNWVFRDLIKGWRRSDELAREVRRLQEEKARRRLLSYAQKRMEAV